MHVAFAIEGLHGLSGGAERVLVDLASKLYENGHQVTVITHEEKNGPSFYPLKFGVQRIDVRPRHSRRKKRPPLDRARSLAEKSLVVATPVWLVQFLPRIFRIRRALKREKPDVVIGFMPSMFTYSTIAALGLPTKTIVSVHNVPTKEFGSDPRRWNQNRFDIRMRRLSLRLADRITVLLPSFKNHFSRSSVREKTSVIPNMIKPYEGVLADTATHPSKNVILAVGRLAEAKDHLCLIRAWKKLEHRFPNWEVKIIGKGPLKKALADQIKKAKLKRIRLDGPTEEIFEEYRKARFLVMPSKYEGFGLVTAEAMSVGLPVIGFRDCPGTNEIIIDDLNGILVDPGDKREVSLAKAMETLIEDEEYRKKLADNARETVERFAPSYTMERWEKLIESLTFKGPKND